MKSNVAEVVSSATTNAPVVPAAPTNEQVAVVESSVPPIIIPVVSNPVVAMKPPAENQATQMTAEIQRIRQDLLAMRETIKDLAKPPAIITAAPPTFTSIVYTSPPPVIVFTTAPPVATAMTSAVIAAVSTSTVVSADVSAQSSASQNTAPPTNLPTRPATVAVTNKIAMSGEKETPAAETPVGRVIRVLNVEQSRFPSSDDFDDMRTFNIVLSLINPRADVAKADIRIEMVFYDEDQNDGRVLPSRSVGAIKSLRPTQAWGSDRRCAVNATYVLPKGERAKNKAAGYDERYYGFTVHVFYRDQLQDEWALPHGLLKQAAEDASSTNTAVAAEAKQTP